MKFTVMGMPAPQGSKRAYFNKSTQRAHVVESSDKVKPWRSAVAHAAFEATSGLPFEGAVMVAIEFYVPRPRSHYSSSVTRANELRANAPKHPTSRPDLDKYVRSTFDGLTDGGLWLDDSQAVDVRAFKRYCNREHPTPCAVVTAIEL